MLTLKTKSTSRAGALGGLAMIAMLAAGCPSFSSLAPFPCAKDGTCPQDLVCNSGQCNCPDLGQPCQSGSDCSADKTKLCYKGMTVRNCDDKQQYTTCYGEGHYCVAEGGEVPCLSACSKGCPAGTSCYAGDLFCQPNGGS